MVKNEKINRSKIIVESLSDKNIDEAKALWISQYTSLIDKYVFLPKSWKTDDNVDTFIRARIGTDKAIVVRYDGIIVGYMTCDVFNFHNEMTAFFPIIGHSALDEYKTTIYQLMYSQLSEILVKEGCLNHIFIYFASDALLRQYLFELGFGLYVVDAFQSTAFDFPQIKTDGFKIRQADMDDITTIHSMLIEFNSYYRNAPLFLKRDLETIKDVEECIEDENNTIFVAEIEKTIVGFINVRISSENDVITLSTKRTGLIDPLGAYIKQDCRHLGIGKTLLKEVFDWCRSKKLENIHVDFESANMFAHQFWPRYFLPTLFSAKRKINDDFR